MENIFTVLKKAKEVPWVLHKKTPTSVGFCDLTGFRLICQPFKMGSYHSV
jgi:hypothetical protein